MQRLGLGGGDEGNKLLAEGEGEVDAAASAGEEGVVTAEGRSHAMMEEAQGEGEGAGWLEEGVGCDETENVAGDEGGCDGVSVAV